MTKKKTPAQKTAVERVRAVALHEMLRNHITDQTRLIEILLARCDAQDKAIGKIEVHNHKMAQEFDTLSTAYIKMDRMREKQDLQFDRLIKINWLMLRELQRFCKNQLEPATIASIHNDLKTPTIGASLEPSFYNRGNNT